MNAQLTVIETGHISTDARGIAWLAVTEGLRLRHVDALTAQEDASDELDDSRLIDRATNLGRVVFTQDEDFLREAGLRTKDGTSFSGVIYAHQLRVSIGKLVEDLS